MFIKRPKTSNATPSITKKWKIFNILLWILAFEGLTTAAYGFDTLAKSAIVFDEITESILFEKEADKPRPPASMSKLMTLLLAFEALDEGRINLATTFRISKKASRKGGSKMFVEENQLVSVEDLIRGIAVASGNDACIALAEGLNGTEDSFVSRMNLKAKDLELTNSHFINSTGWPARGHLMSVRDLLKLSIHIRNKYPTYYKYFQELEYTWNGIKQENRNPLLKLNLGADGLKTGHTEEAGYGLVGSSNLGKRRISFILTGLKTKQERKLESEKIIQWAFREFAITNLFSENHLVSSAPIWIGEKNDVDVITSKEITILIPYGKKNEVQAESRIEIPIEAPIKAGDQVGTLKITAPSFIPGGKDRIIEYPLISASDVKQGSFIKKIQETFKSTILRAFNFANLNNLIN